MMRFLVQAARAGRLAFLLPLLSAAAGTATGGVIASAHAGDADLETARVQFVSARDAVSLRVEIAVRPSAQRRGLMDRTHLAPDAGMLFVYAQAQNPDRGFWMYRTRIALDIAFLDADGRILAVAGMEPCSSSIAWRCPRYRPGVSYRAALEVNRGFFARHDIAVGDRVVLPVGLIPGYRE